MHVLVAEDDDRIARLLTEAMSAAGFVVETEGDGEVVSYRGETEDFDAIILDLGLPTIDGLTVLKRWRRAGRLAPVLILTARGQWEERVEGIEAGADDYVVKPFRVEEVIARIRAIIRRTHGLASSRLDFGDLALDERMKQVFRNGVRLDLPPLEYRLLSYLVHHRGRAVSQLELTEHLYSQETERDSNSIEALVSRIRKRLGPDVIKTRRGYGYFIDGDGE